MSGRCAAVVVLALLAASAAGAEVLAVRAGRLHPVSGPALSDGVVVIEGDRIRAVGRTGEVVVPEGARWLSAAVVTPGLIDAHTSVGLTGSWNVPEVLDQDETSDPNQAALRALDAFHPDEPLLRFLLEHGVTVIQASPGPANPIAGQAGIFRTHGESADAMAIRFPSALVFNLGDPPKRAYAQKGAFPMTRMGTAALIRRALRASAGGVRGWLGAPFARLQDAGDGQGVLARVAAGELPALFVADRADDVLTALRLAREFELDWRLVGGAEAYLVRDALREAGVRVIAGPTMQRAFTPDVLNASYENPAALANAGLEIAIRSGFESYVPRTRVILFEAAVAAANGLGPERALRAITLGPARLLGIENDYGSLQPGKLADLVLFEGDPFETATPVQAVIAGGEVVYEHAP